MYGRPSVHPLQYSMITSPVEIFPPFFCGSIFPFLSTDSVYFLTPFIESSARNNPPTPGSISIGRLPARRHRETYSLHNHEELVYACSSANLIAACRSYPLVVSPPEEELLQYFSEIKPLYALTYPQPSCINFTLIF